MTAYRKALDKFEEYKDFNDFENATRDYIEAANLGHYNIVRAFIKIFGDEHVDAKPSWAGTTALGVALNKGNYKMADFLIDHGANVNATYHRKPLITYFAHEWLFRHRTELNVIYLAEKGANVFEEDHEGVCAFDLVQGERKEKMITLFKDPTAKRDPFVSEINTAFYACRDGYRKTVQKFIDKFGIAPLEQKSHWNKNALMVAIEHRRSLVAGVLLDAGANINVMDGNGTPAIQAYMNYPPVFKEFLNRGTIDINVQNERGNSYIMEAASHGYIDTVKALWDLKPDLTIVNNEGLTLSAMAEMYSQRKFRTHNTQATAEFLKPLTCAYQKKRIKEILDKGSAKKIKVKSAKFKRKDFGR